MPANLRKLYWVGGTYHVSGKSVIMVVASRREPPRLARVSSLGRWSRPCFGRSDPGSCILVFAQ